MCLQRITSLLKTFDKKTSNLNSKFQQDRKLKNFWFDSISFSQKKSTKLTSKKSLKSYKAIRDLIKEMKNVLLKTSVIDSPEMTVLTNKVLPTEMLKAVLEKLDYKSLCSARQICKRWKNIIDGFDLVEKAFGKHLWKCSTISHVFAQTQTFVVLYIG